MLVFRSQYSKIPFSILVFLSQRTNNNINNNKDDDFFALSTQGSVHDTLQMLVFRNQLKRSDSTSLTLNFSEQIIFHLCL